MSLKPTPIEPVPEMTARVAHAAFPKGNPYVQLRDEMGTIYTDADFAHLFPRRGQPGLAPWRLALVTVLQFRENLSDRQAVEAVRARIDWKYLLGLELTDPGFDFSVLTEFRTRLLAGQAETLLLDTFLKRCCEQGLLKARGKQRTDAMHVLAAIRVMNRLELVAETLRAALNELAEVAQDWLRATVPQAWYKRYGKPMIERRLPQSKAKRAVFAQQVGEDGFQLLDLLTCRSRPPGADRLCSLNTLAKTWARHYERLEAPDSALGWTAQLRPKGELSCAGEAIESPYDPEARFRTLSGQAWTGYLVHLSESCDEEAVHLLTHVETTPASLHEANSTLEIQQALAAKGLVPADHLVDSAYSSAALIIESRLAYDIHLAGPTRLNPSWQSRTRTAYNRTHFEIDWENKQMRCPEGKLSSTWTDQVDAFGHPSYHVRFRKKDCSACASRWRCTRAKRSPRQFKLPLQPHYEAMEQARAFEKSGAGWRLRALREGIEGTISQGVRAYGLRQARYCGLKKTHLQHVATAAAINISRLYDWFEGKPREQTRISRFAALAA